MCVRDTHITVTPGSRVVVCDVRSSVLVSVTSNKVLVIVVLGGNVVQVVVFVCETAR